MWVQNNPKAFPPSLYFNKSQGSKAMQITHKLLCSSCCFLCKYTLQTGANKPVALHTDCASLQITIRDRKLFFEFFDQSLRRCFSKNRLVQTVLYSTDYIQFNYRHNGSEKNTQFYPEQICLFWTNRWVRQSGRGTFLSK